MATGNITVKSKELLNAINTVRIVCVDSSKRRYNRGFTLVHLSAINNTLTLYGHNGRTTVTARASCTGAIEFSIPFKELREMVAAAAKTTTTVALILGSDNKLTIRDALPVCNTDGTFQTSVMLNPEDFGLPPLIRRNDVIENVTVEYQADQLIDAIEYVITAISTDDTLKHMSGIYFHGNKVVATDGRRCHIMSGLPSVSRGQKESGWLISATMAKVLITTRRQKPNIIKATFTHNDNDNNRIVHFVIDSIEVAELAIDATFPDYSRIMRSNHIGRLRAERIPLCIALERFGSKELTMISNVDGQVITLLNEDGEARSSATVNGGYYNIVSTDVATDRSEVNKWDSGDEMKIGINARYLSDALQGMGGLEIDMATGRATDPLEIINADRHAVVCTMML